MPARITAIRETSTSLAHAGLASHSTAERSFALPTLTPKMSMRAANPRGTRYVHSVLVALIDFRRLLKRRERADALLEAQHATRARRNNACMRSR